jgi:hypothetical protein
MELELLDSPTTRPSNRRIMLAIDDREPMVIPWSWSCWTRNGITYWQSDAGVITATDARGRHYELEPYPRSERWKKIEA